MTDDRTDERAEQAFRTALARRAETVTPLTLEVPAPRRPRRWPVLVAAAAAAILVVGLVAMVTGHRDEATPSNVLPDNWRWESYRNVLVAVPGDWGQAYAPNDQWCISVDPDVTREESGLPQQGYVDLSSPDMGSTDVACNGGGVPPVAMFVVHLTFLGEGDAPPMPDGWSNVVRSVDGVRLDVVTDAAHRDLANRILATAHVSDQDPNGCPASSPIQTTHAVRPSPAFDIEAIDDVDSITVCQYSLIGTGKSGLRASRVLTGHAADEELRGLQEAPTGGGPDRPSSCLPDGWGDTALVLRLHSGSETHQVYGYYAWCFGNGFDDGTTLREVTQADCRALWGDRVQLISGGGAIFSRCRPPD